MKPATQQRPADAAERETTALAGFRTWWAERGRAHRSTVSRIPFAALDGWGFERGSGNLVHDSGRFFTVEGLRTESDGGAVAHQPIIHQPEIGILGILVRRIDGVLHCLMQAKMEPGNVNTLQLSPTVQATRSNYTRVHRGGRTRCLEYFWGHERGRVLVDVLQSEQGAWFWHKHNRNMIVEVAHDVPEHEDFRWIALPHLLQLLHTDDLVNMDARTVLSCLPAEALSGRPWTWGDPFTDALRRSYGTGDGGPAAEEDALRSHRSWLLDVTARGRWTTRLVPLDQAQGWSRTDDEIVSDDEEGFRVVAVGVHAESREVHQWTQPLLAPREEGLAAFLVRRSGGVLEVLVQARFEPGLLGKVELAPTVRLPRTPVTEPVGTEPPLADVVADEGSRVRFEAVLSEEGGRFHHARTRYQVIEAAPGIQAEAPDTHRWMTVGQLMELARHGHRVNVEARSLLACLHSLW